MKLKNVTIKYISSALFLTALLLMTSAVYASDAFTPAGKNIRGAVVVNKAHVYEYAQSDSEKISELSFGEKVNTVKKNDGWYYVTFKRKGKKSVRGFMKKSELVSYDKTKKHLALTFDDGPSPYTTGKIIKALKKTNSRATFFVLGTNITKKTKKFIKAEKNIGCEVGNHSYSHPDLKYKSAKKVKAQLKKTDSKIKKITGERPSVCRAPYGSYNKKVLKIMNRPNLFWSVDTQDWKYRSSKRLVKYVRKHEKNGAVILMHDIQPSTAKAVSKILKNLKKDGYEAVTVTELAAIRGKKLKSRKTYVRF